MNTRTRSETHRFPESSQNSRAPGKLLSPGYDFWERHAQYVLLLPAIIIFVVLAAFPMVYSFGVSLTKWNLARPIPPTFIGLDNYAKLLFKDRKFWMSLKVTCLFIGGVVGGEFATGLGLGLLLNREFRGKTVVRTIFIIPVMITPVIVGIIWRLLYNPEVGMLNYLLVVLGMSPIVWLGTGTSALLAVIMTDIWEWTPLVALIILAGLHAIPQEPYEAARIDGASSLQLFYFITLPLLRPTIVVALIIRTIDAFKIFDTIYILTSGGPGMGTEVLSIYGYRAGFRFFHMGYASSLTFFMVGMIAVTCILYLRAIKRIEL